MGFNLKKKFKKAKKSSTYTPIMEAKSYEPIIEAKSYEPMKVIVESKTYDPIITAETYKPMEAIACGWPTHGQRNQEIEKNREKLRSLLCFFFRLVRH
jgi:hypothetical protein